jgi:hypothetical protein
VENTGGLSALRAQLLPFTDIFADNALREARAERVEAVVNPAIEELSFLASDMSGYITAAVQITRGRYP